MALPAPVKPEVKPKEKPKPKPKPEAKPKPKAKPKPQAPKKLAKLKPRRKPKPPDPFASVLKNLAQEFKKPKPVEKPAEKKKPEKKKTNFEQEIAQALSQRRISDTPAQQITLSERHAMINEIKKAVEQCWNFQAGAKGAEEIIVEIKVTMRSDGTVSRANVMNQSAYLNSPFKQAAAESARRAVLNPSCQPFKLDPRKYQVWKDLTLSFNPREMLGR